VAVSSTVVQEEDKMRIYDKSLEVVRSVVRLSRRVQEQDPDLARQMRRACMSVPLNMQEGLYSQGGNRAARFYNAMGSARETMACLHVSVAAEYLMQPDVDADLDRIDHVIGALWKLSGKRSR
jgi:four helix bundle protein